MGCQPFAGVRLLNLSETLLNLTRKRFEEARDALESYGETLGNAEAFKVHDVVFRIAGVGSLGVRRYLALIEGDGSPHSYCLLDIKEHFRPPSGIALPRRCRDPRATRPAGLCWPRRFSRGTWPLALTFSRSRRGRTGSE